MSSVTRRRFVQGAAAGAALGAAGLARRPVAHAGRAGRPAEVLDTFSHVVVLMLENRSFDSLLGSLYAPDELPPGMHFEGIAGKALANPIPPGAPAPPGVTSVSVFPATDYHDPYPDPGEVYPNVNTQLFNVVSPPDNLPDPVPPQAPMTGFVTDYVTSYPRDLADPPSFDDYRVIMGCFPRESLPVLATLAREFAVFDHWFASVPSQTWCNRAFWHAATSWGHVVNGGGLDTGSLEWIEDSSGATLFNQLLDAGLDWRIYSSNYASLTGLIHLRALADDHLTRFPSLEQFFSDCAHGALPAYSFLEPNFWTPHNDQHPSSYDSSHYGPAAAGSVLLGENLINRVYDAVRTSHSRRGNNWSNTLLIITHDEHGGCYDHVSPPPAVPPGGGSSRDEDGFAYDRLGVRVPMVMVSAHIAPGTIVNTPHDHTAFLRTAGARWGLPPLTDRDGHATDVREVFTASAVRDGSTWPVIPDHVVPPAWYREDFSGAPLNELQRSIVGMVAALGRAQGLALDAAPVTTVGEAVALMTAVPGLPGANPTTPRSFWQPRARRWRSRPLAPPRTRR